MRRSTRWLAIFASFAVFAVDVPPSRTGRRTEPLTPALAGARPAVPFEPNRGQVDTAGDYIARTATYDVELSSRAMKVSVPDGTKERTAALTMRFVGSNKRASASKTDELPGRTNYYIGNESSEWVTDVPTYAGVRYRSVYPGIDVHYYSDRAGNLEYDFEISPGADPSVIELRFDGTRRLSLRDDGSLAADVGGTTIVEQPPVAYQVDRSARVDVRYVLDGDRVRFALGDYDRAR